MEAVLSDEKVFDGRVIGRTRCSLDRSEGVPRAGGQGRLGERAGDLVVHKPERLSLRVIFSESDVRA